MNKARSIYKMLLKKYGYQGWWPLLELEEKDPNSRGYHPGDYGYPKNDAQRFEICCGAILTQNTAWKNVEAALRNLRDAKALQAEQLLRVRLPQLRVLIRPAGYFNQKSAYLRTFAAFFRKLDERIPGRDELLGLKGIGPETADSMLLYAFKQPKFVVDAYTKSMCSQLGLIESSKYDDVKGFFERQLPREVPLYQEYHALIVEYAKRNYTKKITCPIDESL